jgi:subtilisin-like proprotein convertase family protein
MLCFAGALYFWHMGNRWRAEEHAALHPAVSTAANAKAITPQASATLTNQQFRTAAPLTTASNKLTAVKDRYPYRLTNTKQSLNALIHNDRGILLQNALLDSGDPMDLAIPKRLQAPANNGSYLVQSKGALSDEFRAALQSANATIVSYIPNNAYLVRVSDAGAQQLQGNPLTQSVLAYEPYYKLEPALLNLTMQDANAMPPSGALNVTVFPDAYQSALDDLKQLGAAVVGQDRSPFGQVLKVYAPPGSLSAVASLPSVEGVAAWHGRIQANDLMRVRLGISPDSVTPNTYLGLTGTNVLININDLGVDATHPDLANRIFTLPSETFNLMDPSGHGTHVAGTILGSGSKSSTVVFAEGSATNANFRGMAPDAMAFVLSLDDPDSYLQEQAARTNALISNNSWNYGGDAAYDIEAASYDAAVRDALPEVSGSQSISYVFSAGNSGSGSDNGTGGNKDSILSPATAKNVITVGATEEQRMITNDVVVGGVTNQIFYSETDDQTQVASFSGRGNVGVNTEGSAGRFKPDLVAPGTFVISDRSGQWDTNAYYNPTNYTENDFLQETVNTNALTIITTITVPVNAVGVLFFVSANDLSPSPFPSMPIYVSEGNTPTLTTYDFMGSNYITIPTNSLTLTPGASFTFAVGNGYTNNLSFNASVIVVTTNDTGYFVALSNLNSQLAPYYRYESGTSMAAAGVSGMLACMQQFFENLKLTNSPALMKALMINGSRSLGQLYDFETTADFGNLQGWGLPNMANIIPPEMTNLTAANFSTMATNMPLVFYDQNLTNVLATGQSQTRKIALSSAAQNQDLRITLVWTDPPGNPAAGTKLVNDLDLIVTNLDTGEVFFGNDIPSGSIYNESFYTNDPPIIDSVNNVENVFLQAQVSTNYSITVLGRRVNVNAVTANTNGIVQDYALVISSGDGGAVPNPFFITDVNAGGPTNSLQEVTNVYVVSNAVPLFNQRVGANSQYSGSTNGTQAQWNFYIYTNTPSLTNVNYTNVAFLTFSPPNLGVPRMGASEEIGPPDTNATRFNGADIDLYASTDPSLTNLNPAAIAAAYKSTSRSGTEKILLTNQPQGQVYYIGVKSEDQEGGQYDFFAVATDLPFDQTDANGNTIVTILTPLPVFIPQGGPTSPNHALVLGVSTANITVRKAVVTDTIQYPEFGDLIGTLTQQGTVSPEMAVLNNHSFFTNVNDPAETFLYDDSGENEFPGARKSDGPGTLQNFTGAKAADGIWMFTEVNDNFSYTGAINNFMLTLEPQNPTNGFSDIIPADSWYYDFVDVPANATNLTIFVFNNTTTGAGDVQLYVKRGSFPTLSSFDEEATITPAGGSISINKFQSPPLNAGRYFFGIYNPNPTPQSVYGYAEVDLSETPVQVYDFLSPGNEPLLDDAVTYSTNHVGLSSTVVSTEVGVRIDHPRESDLVLTLISPSGTRVLLAENRGGLDTNGYGSGINITNAIVPGMAGDGNSSTNPVTITNSTGTLVINYNFYTVPDDMRIFYNGTQIYDTGLVPGSGNFAVDFGPGSTPGLIQIVMNPPGSNPAGTNSDKWDYTGSIITRELTYAIFTENTNETTLPIKFALPPFGNGAPEVAATNIFTNSFEGVAAGDYVNLAVVDGWTVLNTNPVKVVTVTALANTGTNVLALHNGSISRAVTTIPGQTYTLTFANHGRPLLQPVSWWPGQNAAEDIAGANPGSLINGASVVPGLVGNAFYFNNPHSTEGISTEQFVDVPDAPDLRFSTSLTMEAWVNTSNFNSSDVYSIIIKYFAFGAPPAGGRAYAIAITHDPFRSAYTEVNTDESTAVASTTTSQVVDGVWTHVSATYDTNGLKIYYNGQLQQVMPYIGSLNQGTAPLGIGGGLGGAPPGEASAAFWGLIDEPTVYSNALSITNIQDIYAAGSAGKVRPSGDSTIVFANVIIGNLTNTITGIDSWTTNIFSFTAISNTTVITISPTLGQDGMLVDSFNLQQAPSGNPTNYFLPEEPLDKLIGENAQGDWRLEVLDNRVGATNPQPTLVSWQLSLILADQVPFAIPLSHAIPQTNSVPPGGIVYFSVNVPPWALFATNSLIANGNLNLLFNQNILPTGMNASDFSLLTGVASGSVTLASNSVPPLVPGQRYFLGVQNPSATATVNFQIEVDFNITTLTNAIPVTSTNLAPGNIPRYFQFDVASNAVAAEFQLINPSGNTEMVIKKGPPLPDSVTFDYFAAGTTSQDVIVVTNSTPVPLGPGRWYIGIFNEDVVPVTYTVEASETVTPNIIILTNGVPFTYVAPPGPAFSTFFEFNITNSAPAALFELYSLSGNVDLTLDRDAIPFNPPFFATSSNPSTNREQIVIRTNLLGTNIVDTWYLGVPNNDSVNVTYTIRAVVSTNGLLISDVPINVTVGLPAPGSGLGPTLSFPTVVGEMYDIEYSTDLVNWIIITPPSPITASGETTTIQDPSAVSGSRFYRIIQVPSP